MDEAVGFVRTLYDCPECNAHKLPPRAHSSQYSADDFDKESVHKVELCVKTWSYERAAVELSANGELFAVCPLDGDKASDSVERAVGSSRYFALKVASSTGKRAYVGVSFKERTEAFDFLAALQEWDEKRVKLKGSQIAGDNSDNAIQDNVVNELPLKDLSLKQGEKLVLKIKRSGDDVESDVSKPVPSPSKAAASDARIPLTSSGGFGLAPPPPGGTRRRGQRNPE